LTGEQWTLWTVRLAVACYLGRVLRDAAGWPTDSAVRQARWLWTLGCGLYLLHVACAFHFFHGWSHAAAFEHTADQTAAVVGWYWGGGLWVNYAFTALWVGDVLVWWTRPASAHPRSIWAYWLVQSVFAFLVVNATVVFGPPFWRWVALGFLLVVWVVRHLRRGQPWASFRPSRKRQRRNPDRR
jgi:hypothetical protein